MVEQRMKFKSLLTVIVLIGILSLISIAGCVSQPKDISAELDEQVELRPGQVVTIDGDDITLKFIEVSGDSRCPNGATCVWEGEVTFILEITYQDELFTRTLKQPGLTSLMSSDIFREYSIDFSVIPYPELDEKIEPEDYRLQLIVKKLPLSGGILATFDVEGEIYRIFVKNEDTIEDILALQRGESQATIPSGKVIGEAVFYNSPWSWHIDPMDVQMAEFTIEVCSGLPSYLEDDLDYWVNTLGQFCPWSAELVEVQDYR